MPVPVRTSFIESAAANCAAPAAAAMILKSLRGCFSTFMKMFLKSEKRLLQVQYSTSPDGEVYRKTRKKQAMM